MKIATQAVKDAKVLHDAQNSLARTRRWRFNQKATIGSTSPLRTNGPTSGLSLFRAFHELLGREEKDQERAWERGELELPPETFKDRYTEQILVASVNQKSLDAVVATLQILHGYTQQEARRVYEFLHQDSCDTKSDKKFYEKKTKIRRSAAARFAHMTSSPFELTDNHLIHTTGATDAEFTRSKALRELYCSLLGVPVFTSKFNPKDPRPDLMSSGKNFDQENSVENHRILAIVSPISSNNLTESLGYKKMREKAQVPVLNATMYFGGGTNGTAQLEAEKPTYEELETMFNDYVGAIKNRQGFKRPLLEVVVDGVSQCAPLSATSADRHPINLSLLARYIQIFAIENGVREIVSCLALANTNVANGQPWRSSLLLEGKQRIDLIVEPLTNDSGDLLSCNLTVGYSPRPVAFDRVIERLRQIGSLALGFRPTWVTAPAFAVVMSVLALAPFLIISVFSLTALLSLVFMIIAFVLAGTKLTKLKWVLPQPVILNAFVALALVAMLFFNILPNPSAPPPVIPAQTLVDAYGSTRPVDFITHSTDDAVSALTLTLVGHHDSAWMTGRNDGSQLIGSQFNFGATPLKDRSNAIYSTTDSTANGRPSSFNGNREQLLANYGDIRVVSPWSNLASTQLKPNKGLINPAVDKLSITKKTREGNKKSFPNTADTARIPVVRDVINVEVIVDTKQIITLFDSNEVAANTVSQSTKTSEPALQNESASLNSDKIVSAVNVVNPDERIAVDKAIELGMSKATSPVDDRGLRTSALVVFSSPTQLANLNKGDVFNANFKPSGPTETDPRSAGLDCTATGIVQDIKHTGSEGVEVRVWLNLTMVRDGSTVCRNLDLLLTDRSKQSGNSHYGVLQASQTEVSRVERPVRDAGKQIELTGLVAGFREVR